MFTVDVKQQCNNNNKLSPQAQHCVAGPCSAVGSASDSRARGPGFDTRSGHILSFSFADSRRAVVSYWQKYVHKALVNSLGGLNLPRKSVVRLTDHPDMNTDVYRRRETTQQHVL